MNSLINIGKSGVFAARSALDLTAQNIANAGNPDYARRTVSLEEVASTGIVGQIGGTGLAGVRIDEVQRSTSLFLQNEARRSSGDLARAEAELTGLSNAESAIEQSGLFASIVDFEASLSRLASDPLGGALRNAVVEEARRLAQTFGVAAGGLDIAQSDVNLSTQAGAEQVNLLAGELARTNAIIARARPGSSNMAVLFDQRDALLKDLTSLTGATAQFDAIGRANVQIAGLDMVSGNQSATFSAAAQADGSFTFAVDGTNAVLASGELLGRSQAGEALVQTRADLDTLAAQVVNLANTAQANGAALDGSTGAPMFSGTSADTISLALTHADQLATAPAGSPAGSRDIGNLQAFRQALANGGPADSTDALLFGLSSAISTRTATRDALRTIAETAEVALAAETGVDLDQEAANLIRFQQAFEANGRVIQVATEVFDTLLGMGR